MRFCPRKRRATNDGFTCFVLALLVSTACHRVSGSDSSTSDRDTHHSDTASSAGTDTATGSETSPNSCDVIKFKDPNFEAFMRDLLDIPSGPIRGSDVSSVEGISISAGLEIRDVTGIECAYKIQRLMVNENPLESIAPLEHLQELDRIHLRATEVEDLSPLSEYDEFTELVVEDCKVESVEPLAGIKFGSLELDGSPINDVTPLSACEVSTLNISRIGLTALPSLKNMGINELYAYENAIEDLTPLSHATNYINTVRLAHNQIADLLPLTNPDFAGVFDLDLSDNMISDLSPLLEVDWLGETWLKVSGNPLNLESTSEILPILCDRAIAVVWGEMEGAPTEGRCGELPP